MGTLLGLDPTNDVRPFLVASCAMGAVRSAQHVLGHQTQRATFAARLDQAFAALDRLDELLERPVSPPVSSGARGGRPPRGRGPRPRSAR